ncbi:hypothetical protein NEOLEDRAFT_1127954 [Neolentinus lepideus HHB14362 ss-1]|uniref:Uncharacterized protein n=1 Tax=Neolentinus lepideus HHB14362 ss-1 TaxID=1314782 RepID=A0A165V7D2_9AGAM|nr:hypothetical protein NEOLEDRAFT_1127954 [Neolentinus lepideus HHB14362 ss-1]
MLRLSSEGIVLTVFTPLDAFGITYEDSSGNRHLPMATYMGIPAYTSLCRPTEDYTSGGFHYSISPIPDGDTRSMST